MVRIKHRYLLIDILYPEPSSHTHKPSTATTTTTSSSLLLPPHLHFHPPTPDTLTSSVLARLLRETVSDLFGDYGVGKLGGASTGNLIVKYLSPATSTVIIRCPRAAYRLVWAALTYINSIPAPGGPSSSAAAAKKADTTRSVVFRVVRVSGTMRKAEEEAIRRARREIGRTKRGRDGLEGLFGRDAVDVGGRGGGGGGGDDEAVLGMDIDEEEDDEDEDEDED